MLAPTRVIVSTTRSLVFIDRLLESKTRYQDRALEGCSQAGVTAPVKEQRRSTRCPVQRHHPADNDPVIAALMNRVYRAANCCRATVEQRAPLPVEEGKRRRPRMCPPAGEIGGEILLVSVEDVHRKALHCVNGLTCFRRLPHAEQDQRRIERHCGEGVRRQRADHTVDLGRDDRHARGEVPDGLTEGARIDHAVTPRLPSTALTSFGLIRSGTVQPFKSYSAMHCSANPLYLALAPVRSATISVSNRMLSWLPK